MICIYKKISSWQEDWRFSKII